MARDIASVQRAINQTINEVIEEAFRQREGRFRSAVRDSIEKVILRSPEVASLQADVLRGQLGLTDAENKVAKVAETFAEGIDINVYFDQAGTTFKKSRAIRVTLDDGAFDRIMALDEAYQVNTSADGSRIGAPSELPWLYWLVFGGIGEQVSTHRLKEGTVVGRSGLPYIMIPGGSWSVPPEFAGTRTNNFLTRALDRGVGTLKKDVGDALKDVLRKASAISRTRRK